MDEKEFLAQYFFNEDSLLNSRANLLFVAESILYLGFISALQMRSNIDIIISGSGILVTWLFISILKITRINLEYVKKKLRTEFPYYEKIKKGVDKNSDHWLNQKGRGVNFIMCKWLPYAMLFIWLICFGYSIAN